MNISNVVVGDVFTSTPFETPATLLDFGDKVVQVLGRHVYEVIGALWAFEVISYVNLRYWIGARALSPPLKGATAAPTSYSLLKICLGTWGFAIALYFAGYTDNGVFPWWNFAVLPIVWWAAMKTIRKRGPLSVYRTAEGGIASIVTPGTYTKSSEIFLGICCLIAAVCGPYLASQPLEKPSSWFEMGSLLSLYSMMFVTGIFSLGNPYPGHPYPVFSKPRAIPLRSMMSSDLLICLITISIILPAFIVKGKCGPNCKEGMAHFEDGALDILFRTLVIPYQASSMARMMSLFFRMDFAQQDTTIELKSVSLENIPLSKRNGAVEDGVTVPEDIPDILSHKPTYYKTAQRAWVISYLVLAFCLQSVFPRCFVAFFGMMICPSAVNVAVRMRASMKGGKEEVERVLNYVEPEWQLDPVEPLPLLRQDEEEKVDDGQELMETM